MSWALFWQAVFIIALLLFAGMAVWVSIGGLKDLRELFRQMEKEAEKHQNHQTD